MGTAGGPEADLSRRRRALLGSLAYVVLVAVPVMLTAPGRVIADTKSYPYLDPDRFIGRIASVWDPNIGLGTVTHQNIGYLFPLGPFYWLTHGALGLPAWVAQRLWLTGLIVLAGFGVRYLLRTLEVDGPGVPVAMLVYSLTPYATEYSARLSVLLGPWSALPWLVAFAVRALRTRGWKYPALFALTVLVVGSVNATALLYALIGPALYVVFAIWVRHETTLRDAWQAIWRTGLLTFLTSLWWMIALGIEGRFGMGILRFTESINDVSHTATATEIVRGLGYWFFYGGDLRGQWNDSVLDFTRRPWLIMVSFLLPALALLAIACVRWIHRSYFVTLVLVGLVIAVGASPYEHPTPLGRIYKSFATGNTVGFALRSTARATPLLVLGFAAMLGVGVTLFARSMSRRNLTWVGVAAAVVVGVMCFVNAPGLWNGRYYSRYLERDEAVPRYWQQALSYLDARGHDTRVLALPGADFASYRWGDTIDPIEPGLMDRPYVARELVPWGGEASTNLLIALDRRVQDRLLEPAAIAPVARLMGVGDVLLRLDLQTDQFNIVSARDLADDLMGDGVPKGLDPPKTFGTKIPGRLLGADIGDPSKPVEAPPKPVVVLGVKDAQRIVGTRAASDPIVLDGDGEGIVDAAGLGIVDGTRMIVNSPQYNGSAAELRARIGKDALLLVTDTNRRAGMRWAGMRNNYGYTEVAGEKPLKQDLLDQRLQIYPDVTDRARTVTELRGVKSVRATTYGNPAFGFTPQARPALALDGDRRSAWEVAAGDTVVRHERIEVELEHPITTDRMNLVQATSGGRGRWITRAGVRLDGGPQHVYAVNRHGDSFVEFPMQKFSKFEVQILGTDQNKVGKVASEAGRRRKTGVGFEEIVVRDRAPGAERVTAREVTRMPLDLVESVGRRSASHPLAYVMTSPADAGVWRRFVVPTDRSFGLTGRAFLSGAAKDDAIDRALGIPGPDAGGLSARSSERISNLAARASSAFDGDETTAWNSRARDLKGQWIEVTNSAPVTFDHLDLVLLDDGRHSVPTTLHITSDSGESRDVSIPAGPVVDGRQHVRVDLPAVTGRQFAFTLTGVRVVTQPGANRAPITMPVGIVEMGIPGVRRPAVPAEMPAGCLDGQLTVDGAPISVRVTGSTTDAVKGRPLAVTTCDGAPLALGAGSHELRARARRTNGVALSQFVLGSDAQGGPATPADLARAVPAATNPRGPRTTVREQTRSSLSVAVHDAKQPFFLVLGQSHNTGWRASIDGHDLGEPDLVDGYANGWRIDPAEFGANPVVSLRWEPQRWVWVGLAVSAIATLVAVGIVIVAWRRRRRSTDDEPVVATPPPVLESPFAPAPVPAGRTVALAAVLVGLATTLIVGGLWGLAVALATVGALRSAKVRGVVRLLPAILLVGIAIYITSGQLRHNYPPNFQWPTFFERARNVTWFAIALAGVDVVVTWLARRRRAGPA